MNGSGHNMKKDFAVMEKELRDYTELCEQRLNQIAMENIELLEKQKAFWGHPPEGHDLLESEVIIKAEVGMPYDAKGGQLALTWGGQGLFFANGVAIAKGDYNVLVVFMKKKAL